MKKAFISVLFLCFLSSLTAQDTKSFREKEFSILVGPSITNIKNDNISSDQYATTKGANWFNFGINYCKYFNKNIGLLIGLEYSRYKNETSYKGAFRSTDKSVDRDGYIYYAVSEADYKDTRTVHCGEVPIGLRLQVPLNKNAEFFVDFGVRLDFIASAKIESKGTLNKKGAYPNPNYDNVFILIDSDPYYPYTNTTYNSKIDIPVNRVNFSYFVGGGIKASLGENSFIVINPCYMKSITDFTNKENRPEYINVFGAKTAYKKYTLTQFALRVGVGFAI
jgi:hypothetical protein